LWRSRRHVSKPWDLSVDAADQQRKHKRISRRAQQRRSILGQSHDCLIRLEHLQWAAASRDLHNAITSVTSASGFHGASHPGQKSTCDNRLSAASDDQECSVWRFAIRRVTIRTGAKNCSLHASAATRVALIFQPRCSEPWQTFGLVAVVCKEQFNDEIMRAVSIAGFVLVILGIALLLYCVSPILLLVRAAEQHETNLVLPSLGGVALICGMALLFASRPRN
jgi:hypothetical protein